MKQIKISKTGRFKSTCILKNKNVKSCMTCDNLLSIRSFYGRIDKIMCKNRKIP